MGLDILKKGFYIQYRCTGQISVHYKEEFEAGQYRYIWLTNVHKKRDQNAILRTVVFWCMTVLSASWVQTLAWSKRPPSALLSQKERCEISYML
jgi:hypothetical protein